MELFRTAHHRNASEASRFPVISSRMGAQCAEST